MRLAVCLATHTAQGLVGVVVLLRKGVVVEKKDLRRWKFLFPFFLWEMGRERVRCGTRVHTAKTRMVEKDVRDVQNFPLWIKGRKHSENILF